MAKILVVDDDEGVRSILRRVLAPLGHDVLEAGDGEAALQTSLRERPDLVITDLNLPGKNGDIVIRELRDMHPPPIIVAMSGLKRVLLYVQQDVDDTMQKPFDVDVLVNMVGRLLGHKRP